MGDMMDVDKLMIQMILNAQINVILLNNSILVPHFYQISTRFQ